MNFNDVPKPELSDEASQPDVFLATGADAYGSPSGYGSDGIDLNGGPEQLELRRAKESGAGSE